MASYLLIDLAAMLIQRYKEGVSMLGEKTDNNNATLGGDWSLSGVINQLPYLVEHLASLSDTLSDKESQVSTATNPPEVHMAGINELDAGGCQLLTLFVHLLKQKGAIPRLTGIPDAIRRKIIYLGFARELGIDFDTPRRCV
jgi:ABC-type transporter Mla MlaB component